MREETDVLVIGSGIAGITASIEAARNGASVTLACAGPLFGGSSFYPGTWGLGLIGPIDAEDETDLIATIEDVGCGVANPVLVETFVRGIRPSISWLEDELDVELKRPSCPESAREATFIPCFDHKCRMWRGITRDSLERAARRHIDDLGISVLERCELMELIRGQNGAPGGAGGLDNDDIVETDIIDNGGGIASTPDSDIMACSQDSAQSPVVGAILYDASSASLFIQSARAIILATGGTGGLFERSLTSRDVLSSAHGIALNAGCSLVNIEFMQMMPGLVEPVRGVVFNEKTFRYAMFDDPNGVLPANPDELADLLETRSGHGPFTCRLHDEAVDLAIDAAGKRGISVRFDFPKEHIPEFVRTFSNWMEDEQDIDAADVLRVAMYAHAANGGIRIDEKARTDVPGLFACGEVTGGMHGADRIGGLSSANGLVFGRIAGMNAALLSQSSEMQRRPTPELDMTLKLVRMSTVPLNEMDSTRISADMRRTMSTHAMIGRTEHGLLSARHDIERLLKEVWHHDECRGCVIPTDSALARGIRISSQLRLAHAMLEAMRGRRNSLGPHLRADIEVEYP